MMNRFFRFKDQNYNLEIPDIGPLEINSYKKFLEKSRELFIEKWDAVRLRNTEDFQDSSEALLFDYEKLKLIGSGSFGKVYLVKHKQSKSLFAMKAISKQTIIKYRQLEHTKTEKLVLFSTNCPFTLRLEHCFIDNSFVYFILPFMQGGELYYHLKLSGKFEENSAMFYIAQVILAIEYLHFMDIVYRDIKPENIMLDHTGYLKLADFGFCKHLTKGRTYTLCGTPEYLAPEVIMSKGYGKSVDWWSIGILIYELSAGFTPFRDRKAIQVYENILKGIYKMPNYFSSTLKDLIRNILQADISRRFGNLRNGAEDFKEHKWFRPLNWQAVLNRKVQPPIKHDFDHSEDTKYFSSFDYESLDVSSQEMYPEEFNDF